LAETVEIPISETGYVLEVQVMQRGGGGADNISSATDLQVHLEAPNGRGIERTAAFTSDGTDGKLRYTATSADVNGKGVWKIRGHYHEAGSLRHTEWGTFRAIA
jgi:hypothetical protein